MGLGARDGCVHRAGSTRGYDGLRRNPAGAPQVRIFPLLQAQGARVCSAHIRSYADRLLAQLGTVLVIIASK